MGILGHREESRRSRKRARKPRKGSTKKHIETPPKLEWIRIGIPGFEELLERGIPKGVNILVAGGPGTGKTIFCLQTLYNAARDGHDCLYITFEELPARLRTHIHEFGWDVRRVEQKGKILDLKVGEKGGSLIIQKLDPFRIARSVEALLAKAAGQLSIEMRGIPELFPPALHPHLIALDSISALESAFTGKPESYRIYIEQLFRLFEEVEATTFLITETEEAPTKFSRTGVEEFLADGVFVLYNFKIRDIRVRAIEILKLRGAKHQRKLVPIDITEKGLVVFPSERIYEMEEIR